MRIGLKYITPALAAGAAAVAIAGCTIGDGPILLRPSRQWPPQLPRMATSCKPDTAAATTAGITAAATTTATADGMATAAGTAAGRGGGGTGNRDRHVIGRPALRWRR